MDVDRGAIGVESLQTQVRRERQCAPLRIYQVRADQGVSHSGCARAQRRKKVVKLAVSDCLSVVTRRVELVDDWLTTAVDGLTASERVAAIEEQARPPRAQGL